MKPSVAIQARWLLCAFVVGAALLAFAPTLQNEFTYDDKGAIVENELLGMLRHPGTYFSRDYFEASGESTYRPLVSASYAIDLTFWGRRPFGYHLTNILWHAAAAALLFCAALELGAAPFTALAAGLLYAVHPLGAEATCCVGFREDLMCAAFYLAAFLCWPTFGSGGGGGAALAWRRPWPRTVAALAFFAAALLSKEMALSFPALAMAKEWRAWRQLRADSAAAPPKKNRRRPTETPVPWRTVAPRIGLAWALAFAALGLFLGFHGPSTPNVIALRDRLGMFAVATAGYLRLFAFPYPLRATYYFLDLGTDAFDLQALASAAGVAAVAAAGFFYRRRWREEAGALLAFFLLLVPVSNLIPIYCPMAERYMALPLAALCYGLAHGLARIPRPAWRTAAVAALTVAWGGWAFARAGEWRTEETLWGADIRHGTPSPEEHVSIAKAEIRRSQFDRALAELTEVKRTHSDNPKVLSAWGDALRESGHPADSERWYLMALEIWPDFDEADRGLALARVAQNKFDEALEPACQWQRLNGWSITARLVVGDILAHLGQSAKAAEAFAQARQRAEAAGETALAEKARALQERTP